MRARLGRHDAERAQLRDTLVAHRELAVVKRERLVASEARGVRLVLLAVHRVDGALGFGPGVGQERCEELEVQHAHLFVRDALARNRGEVLPALQHDVGPVAQERHLGEQVVVLGRKHALAHAAEGDELVAVGAGALVPPVEELAVEPRAALDPVGGVVERRVAHRTIGIEVEQDAARRLQAVLVELAAERVQRPRLVVLVDDELVGVDGEAPAVDAVAAQQELEPRRAEVRERERQRRAPQVHVGLPEQPVGRAVVRAVVHEQESVDAQAAVVGEEPGQPCALVAHGDAAEDRVRRDGDVARVGAPKLVGVVRVVERAAPLEAGDVELVQFGRVGEPSQALAAQLDQVRPAMQPREQSRLLDPGLPVAGIDRPGALELDERVLDPSALEPGQREAVVALGPASRRVDVVGRVHGGVRERRPAVPAA